MRTHKGKADGGYLLIRMIRQQPSTIYARSRPIGADTEAGQSTFSHSCQTPSSTDSLEPSLPWPTIRTMHYNTAALIVPAPALANIRDTVAGWTLKSLAASAAVLVPVETIVTISSC
jgi:hypothetical protein